MDLNKLFKPSSIAIVGASDKPGPGGNVSRACSQSPVWERTYLINPRKEELFGKLCYKSLADLPEVVDVIVICTPKTTCASLLSEAGELGTKAAVIFASGFSEDGTAEGKALEAELLAIARRYGIAVLGPNCNGCTNNVNRVFMTMPGIVVENGRPTGIGMISQSGYLSTRMTQPPYMSISYGISVGNGNCLTSEDCLEFLIGDPDTNVIAMYLEGVRNGRKFIRMLKKAIEEQKPVVILKAGKSAKGAKATASHTASIAGSQQMYQSIFDKFNVISVDSLQELVNTAVALNILKKHQFPKPGKVASLNLSGAENVLCADHSEASGVEHAELRRATIDKINALLPEFASAANPLDMTTTFINKIPETVELLRTVSDDPDVSVVTVGGEVDDCPVAMVASLVESMIAARKTVKDIKPLFMLSLVEASRDIGYRRRLEEAGIPILSPGITAYSMLAKIMKYVAYRPEDHMLTLVDGEAASGQGRTAALSEFDSKQLLQKNGIDIPWQVAVKAKEALAKELQKAPFPVAIKINSPDILHKSDAGGVKLNLQDVEGALQAYDEIMANCSAYDPKARIEGVLVSAMAPAGLEFIVGIKNDPQLGPFVLVGMGGVFVEVFKDVALMPAPVNEKEALEMLKLLKTYKLLNGYRGGPLYDVDALVRLIVKISLFAVTKKDTVAELDINPVFVYPQGEGVAVIDALVIGYNS